MVGMRCLQAAALLAVAAGLPGKKVLKTMDLDRRTSQSLIRKDPTGSQAARSSSDTPITTPKDLAARSSSAANTTVTRFRRGPWGTMTCDTHTVPVENAQDCETAAVALGGTWNSVGSTATAAPLGCVMRNNDDKTVSFVTNNDTTATYDDATFASLCDTNAAVECPSGYTKESGDCCTGANGHVEQWGASNLGSYQGGLYADTIGDCASKCTAQDGCKSFKWSPSYTYGQAGRLVCILQDQYQPDTSTPWMDFEFCSKDSAAPADSAQDAEEAANAGGEE